MKKTPLLTKLKGEVVVVYMLSLDYEGEIIHNLLKLIDFDSTVLQFECYNKKIIYMPYSECYYIEKADEEGITQFEDYRKSLELDPSWLPSEELKNKGYTVIKKRYKDGR